MLRFAFPLLVVLGSALAGAEPVRKPAVAELFEDDAEGLLAKLKNHEGEGRPEKDEVFSGSQSVKIMPMQRYDREILGWKYRIVEKPKMGEYRYLRYAWKTDECVGVMLQLHDAKDWHIRYTAGQNTQGWETKFVAAKPPAEWVVVTRDLYADFGERTIQGLALTVFGGKAAYFDHVYFGRTVEDLDRIDATVATDATPKALSSDELLRLWLDLGGQSAPRDYAAMWRLRASPAEAIPFLKGKLAVSDAAPNATQIQKWVLELDAARYLTREVASKKLGENLEIAALHLEAALRGKPSPEQRSRLEKLLAGWRSGSVAPRMLKAVQVLEFMETPESRKCLEELSKGPEGARPTVAAQHALRRLAANRP
jgi:hypothetical protein